MPRIRDREPSLAPADRRGGRRVPGVSVPDVDNAAATAPAVAERERVQIEERRQRGVRPIKPGYHETPLLSIGKEVRVQVAGRSRRALIECVNDGEGTVDIMYTASLGESLDGTEDEAVVPVASVQSLEGFEILPEGTREAALAADFYVAVRAAKEDGNQLFKIKDYDAAAQLYGLAVDELRHFKAPSPGSESWVLMNQGGALVLGSVRSVDADAQKAEVAIYRPEVEQLQVYAAAPWRALIPVHEEHLALHCSLYMNRAKCFAQVGYHQEAAQDLTVAIGLWASHDEGARRGGGKFARALSGTEVAEQKEQLAKAYFLRAKTRLARLKLDSARSDLREAKALEPVAAMVGLLQQLERDIEVAQREQVRSNKHIAKEVAKWADKALSSLDSAGLAALELSAAGAGGSDAGPSQHMGSGVFKSSTKLSL